LPTVSDAVAKDHGDIIGCEDGPAGCWSPQPGEGTEPSFVSLRKSREDENFLCESTRDEARRTKRRTKIETIDEMANR
jgi:hypothetical protein